METYKRHDRSDIAIHWFNAACWLLLFVTGVGLLLEEVQVRPEAAGLLVEELDQRAAGGHAEEFVFNEAVAAFERAVRLRGACGSCLVGLDSVRRRRHEQDLSKDRRGEGVVSGLAEAV